jgi:peptidoglycan glycosyltransferase
VAWTSRWTVFDADALKEKPTNRRALLREQQHPRGRILASDGTVLARSEPVGHGEGKHYVRHYPLGELFGQPVGYAFITQDSAGIERSHQDELTGDIEEFSSIIDQLLGHGHEGLDVHTSLNVDAQRTATQALGGRKGAVVALDPKTGRVLTMVSVKGFDSNLIPDHFRDFVRDDANSPLLNRATQGRYPPGSTMKVVTASAAIDSGRYTADSIVSGKSPKTISGTPLSNCCGEGTGNFGPLSLKEALTNSVNTVWAEVGEKLGKDTYFKYMKRFGFLEKPPLDYPDDQLTASGVRNTKGKLLSEKDGIDIGRVAIGQERLQVTPLQMAMVVSAVANGGKLMKPIFMEKAVARDGRVKERGKPEEYHQVMKSETAATVRDMMVSVVEQGTATAAKIPGIKVAGKTGTAEVDSGDTNQAWFICFAPADDPKVALAVTVERTQGQGGTVAAPIGKQVLEVLLRG